jgi:hypothetical protein
MRVYDQALGSGLLSTGPYNRVNPVFRWLLVGFVGPIQGCVTGRQDLAQNTTTQGVQKLEFNFLIAVITQKAQLLSAQGVGVPGWGILA